MVKRDGKWLDHFTLKKTVEVSDEPEAIVAIDRGEHNLAVAVALLKSNPNKPIKGQFWKGEEIKRIRGLYGHIRRKLQEKKMLKKVKELRKREKRKVNQQLYIIANQIISYAKQFSKPVIVMENLNGIRQNFRRSRALNKRFHSLPFRKLQTILEYKAALAGIEVRYLPKNEVKNTSKTCHRCGHVTQVKGRIYKCPKCKMEYDRDLNACVNIAHRVTSSMRWGSRKSESPEPADEENKRKAISKRWKPQTSVAG
jgi:IS605 OrfB family transposase